MRGLIIGLEMADNMRATAFVTPLRQVAQLAASFPIIIAAADSAVLRVRIQA